MYRNNLVFAAACLGMLLFGIVFLSLGSVNNMLAERFGLGDIAIGTLTALLPGDTTAHQRLDAALAKYKRRIAGVWSFMA